jgi:hypothetical protein
MHNYEIIELIGEKVIIQSLITKEIFSVDLYIIENIDDLFSDKIEIPDSNIISYDYWRKNNVKKTKKQIYAEDRGADYGIRKYGKSNRIS